MTNIRRPVIVAIAFSVLIAIALGIANEPEEDNTFIIEIGHA